MKMCYIKCLFISFLCLQVLSVHGRGVNGGVKCAACTIVTGIVQQLSYLEGETLVKSVERLCNKLPVHHRNLCFEFAHVLEPLLVNKKFLALFTPDLFCYAVGSCHKDDGQSYCHLFPRPQHNFQKTVEMLNVLVRAVDFRTAVRKLYLEEPSTPEASLDEGIDFCRLPLVKEICSVFLQTVDLLQPAEDIDKDGHSILSHARGVDWRGKDCNDLDPAVHPGAKPINYDKNRDSNCNGIYGIDPVSRTPWEQKLCPTNVGSRGLIYIGDSFGAHFHFPRTWMDPRMINLVNPEVVSDAVMDELDWPEVSYATGFKDAIPPDLSKMPPMLVDSIYLRMRARNRCNHRDYVNLSQNGAAARDFSYIVNKTLVRNKDTDKPALLLYAFMGNDVCNRFRDTVGNMTPPEEFRENVLATLNVLDTKLPNGSHIVLVGLLDGDFIYPEMAEKVHPVGSVLGNVLYKDVYEWFTCMEIGPCNGWMTGNATLRSITSEWSYRLNAVLKDIAVNSKYDCCKFHYVDSPASKAIDLWKRRGRSPSELIEPVDSVHPNQLAQAIIAQILWEDIFENLPRDVVGPLNPSNRKIKTIFGNQGGH